MPVVGVRGLEQGRGAVLAAQRELERLGRAAAAPTLSRSAACSADAEPLDLGLDLAQLGGGLLEGRVEADLALLVDGDGRLEGGELALGLGGPLGRGGERSRASRPISASPASMRLRRAPTCPASLASPSRRSAAARASRASRACSAAYASSARLAGGHRGSELLGDLGDLGEQLGLGGAGLGGLGAQFLGVATRSCVSSSSSWDSRRTRSRATEAVDSSRSRSEVSRTNRSWARVSSGAASMASRSRSASCSPQDAQGVLDGGAALDEGGLVSDLLLEGRRELDEVVGEEAEPSIACLGLDDSRRDGRPRPDGRADRADGGSLR